MKVFVELTYPMRDEITLTRDDWPGLNSVTVISEPLRLTFPTVTVALQAKVES